MEDRMEIDQPREDDDAYVSEEDDDFDPNAAQEDETASKSSESEPEKQPSGKGRPRKRRGRKAQEPPEDEAEDAGFENSGDEGIIQKGQRRRQKTADEEDSGGEGGFVQTRRMKAEAAKDQSNKPLAASDGKITMDIDALWKDMKAASEFPTRSIATPSHPAPSDDIENAAKASSPPPDFDMVTIPRTYTFAGRVTTQTETVPRSSEQAQRWLASQAAPAPTPIPMTIVLERQGPEGQTLYRPLRRRSAWDPNPEGTVHHMPTRREGSQALEGKPKGLRVVDKSKLGWHGPAAVAKAGGKAKEKAPAKLNVVDKSKMDWAEHVQQAGDRDALNAAAKSKGDYLERQRFLNRVEGRKDEEYAKAKGIV